jgi:hypothetical protein
MGKTQDMSIGVVIRQAKIWKQDVLNRKTRLGTETMH